MFLEKIEDILRTSLGEIKSSSLMSYKVNAAQIRESGTEQIWPDLCSDSAADLMFRLFFGWRNVLFKEIRRTISNASC